jgi:hypothetical protein
MEKLITLALTTLVSAFVGSYLAGYLKKKGENLATKEDIQDLAAQTALLTQTAKEIEAKITDKVWDRQKRWELKRDQILQAVKGVSAVKNALIGFQFGRATATIVTMATWDLASDELERTIGTLGLVCGTELCNALENFLMFNRKTSIQILEGDTEAFSKNSNELAIQLNAITKAMRKELAETGFTP